MTICPGSFARTYGTCPYCDAVFDPSEIPGLCITVPHHEPLKAGTPEAAQPS